VLIINRACYSLFLRTSSTSAIPKPNKNSNPGEICSAASQPSDLLHRERFIAELIRAASCEAALLQAIRKRSWIRACRFECREFLHSLRFGAGSVIVANGKPRLAIINLTLTILGDRFGISGDAQIQRERERESGAGLSNSGRAVSIDRYQRIPRALRVELAV